MNAVGGFRQVNPCATHRAIGASRNGEHFRIFRLLEIELGVVGIGWKLCHGPHLMGAFRRRGGIAADGCGINQHRAVVLAIDHQALVRFVGNNAGDDDRRLLARTDDDDAFADDETRKGIEGHEKILVHMKLLGQGFRPRSEAQPFHLGHLGIISGDACDDFLEVLGRDRVSHGNRLGRPQPLPQVRAHDPVDFQPVDFLKAADGPGDIFPGNPVNHPGIGPRPVQQHLQLDGQGTHPLWDRHRQIPQR